MSFFEALLSNSLLQSALFAAILASIASGVVGSYVVVKRIAFISGSIAHSMLGGMGFALWLGRTREIGWLTPLHGAFFAGILSALAIGWIHLRFRQREDSLIAAIWSGGMAIGVIFIAKTPGSNVDLASFLVGSILWVNSQDLWMLFFLDLFILVTVSFLYKKLLLIAFDEEQAYLQGLPVKRLYLTLLVLIAISIVFLIQVVGIILVIAMLTLPPTIANLFTNRLTVMMTIAVALGVCFSFSGTITSYYLDWPPGATIALLAGSSYLLLLFCKRKSLLGLTSAEGR